MTEPFITDAVDTFLAAVGPDPAFLHVAGALLSAPVHHIPGGQL